MNKIIKYSLLSLILLTTFGCASDGWYAQQSREKFIRLSPEERNKERDRIKKQCIKLGISSSHIACQNAPEPTPEEQERLKNKDSWKYKIRSWYYRVW
jgi:hypothetical protein